MQLQYQRQMQMTMQQQMRAQQALLSAQLRAAQAQVQQYQEQVVLIITALVLPSSVKQVSRKVHSLCLSHACLAMTDSWLSTKADRPCLFAMLLVTAGPTPCRKSRCLHCCNTFGHAFGQALQYKTQATQAQLKAQQEAEARKRVEAEAARAVAARMTEKPRVRISLSC